MVFSSIEFIFRFLLVFFPVYYLTPRQYKNAVLLIASIIFYAFGEPKYVLIMILSIGVNYAISLKMERSKNRKGWLVLAVVFDLAMLFIFKYLNFAIGNINAAAGKTLISPVNIRLPIGISFYTFQILSYMIDVYRRKFPAERTVLPFATYVAMFPQLIAGPIVNYSEVRHEIHRRRVTVKDIEAGCVAFVIGLTYKVLLANQIATLWNDVQTAGVLGISTPVSWLGAWAYTFQIFFDFAGYSMMAIGLGRMMGFYFPINFADPYTSRSFTEFWRRWHITLGRWFREYVYIPLGGNRRGTVRTLFNLLVVWALTGLWHGASWNFVIWGLIHFALIASEKFITGKYLKRSKAAGHIYLLLILPVTWVVFAITDPGQLILYLKRMFFIPIAGTVAANGLQIFLGYIGRYWWLFLLCAFGATSIPMRLIDKYYDKPLTKVIFLVLFWMCVYQLLTSGSNPFLYFRF